MVDTFGTTLRALRQQRGLSLDALAAQTHYGKAHLGRVETGGRAPTAGIAAACDQALGTAPLLATLLSIEKGDPVLRRALLGGTLAAGTSALLASVDGTAALAAVLDCGLREAAARPADWDTLADDFARRHVLAPSAQFGAELAAQITVAQQRVAAGDLDATRGAALLSLTYGLWIGDTGRIPTAHSLYATAAMLADRSGDAATRALVRARAANRAVYEGWDAGRARVAIAHALAITAGGAAGLEAYGARVHLAALTGDLAGGRAAVRDMAAVAETLPDARDPSAAQRVASFHAYLECRLGTLDEARTAYEAAESALYAVPLWLTDATLYWARALVRHGRVAEGAATALDAMRELPLASRVLGIGVRDVLSVAPPGSRDETLQALRGYAAGGPAPWETL